MNALPLDVARCPGHSVFDKRTYQIRTDLQCEGCHRLIAARADTSAWIEAGRPTRGDRDRTPDMRVTWMSAPDLRTQPCPSRIDTDHPHAVAEERRVRTDITNPLHGIEDVDLVNAIRARVAIERGLEPSDYDHLTPRIPCAQEKSPTGCNRSSFPAA